MTNRRSAAAKAMRPHFGNAAALSELVIKPPHFGEVSYRPMTFKKFRIFIQAVGISEPSALRDVINRVESELGFRFPGGMPVYGDICKGFEFEGQPRLQLPKGWSQHDTGQENELFHIRDDMGRFRGYNDRNSLTLYPRFRFNQEIVARTTHRVPLFMPKLTDGNDLAMPCFIYTHIGFWPTGRDNPLDFTRTKREFAAITKAQRFISIETRKTFPGVYLPRGIDETIISEGRHSMRMGIPVPGDIFSHWDEDQKEIDLKLAKLRALLEKEVPKILGAENSLILKLFPTEDQVAEVKANPPSYTPPAPQRWQQALFWALG